MSSQVLLTPQIITKETLMILENNLVMANRVNRSFENQFVKIGSSLTIRKPNRYTVRSGASLGVQDIAEPSVSISIDKQRGVDFQFTSQDLTLTVEDFSERYLKPAMATLANQVDYDCLQDTFAISNLVGTPNVIPATFSSSVQLIGRRLDENAAGQNDRSLVLNPAAYWAIANGLSPSFVMPTAKEALVKGYLSTIGNHEVYMDQNIPNLATTAAQHNTSVAMVISTASGTFTGNTTVMYGGTATENIAVGEVFTVANCFNINPQNRQSTGVLKNFTVTATSTPTSSNWTITFTPSIVTSGPYQNVTGPMQTASSVTWLTGTSAAVIASAQNIAFQRDAFGLVMVPMEIPQGVDFAARETYRNISMRVIRAYDINNDVFPTRVDILYGNTVYYDELGCRLVGA
jgi:hypothetical protein